MPCTLAFFGVQERWVTVAVDDWIPCDASTGHPVFARPKVRHAGPQAVHCIMTQSDCAP